MLPLQFPIRKNVGKTQNGGLKLHLQVQTLAALNEYSFTRAFYSLENENSLESLSGSELFSICQFAGKFAANSILIVHKGEFTRQRSIRRVLFAHVNYILKMVAQRLDRLHSKWCSYVSRLCIEICALNQWLFSLETW